MSDEWRRIRREEGVKVRSSVRLLIFSHSSLITPHSSLARALNLPSP
jgi:hypothetical protein